MGHHPYVRGTKLNGDNATTSAGGTPARSAATTASITVCRAASWWLPVSKFGLEPAMCFRQQHRKNPGDRATTDDLAPREEVANL